MEGAEDRVLTDHALDRYRFLSLTVERPSATLQDRLRRRGYLLIKRLRGFDSFYVHEDFEQTYLRNVMSHWSRQRGRRPGP